MFQNLLKLMVPLSKYNVLKIKVIFLYFKQEYVCSKSNNIPPNVVVPSLVRSRPRYFKDTIRRMTARSATITIPITIRAILPADV